jgi:hypothetical protein
MNPADSLPGPWTAETQFADGCLWAEVGKIDYQAASVQLLMKDTRVGVQKAFTLRRGDVIPIGRFIVRIAPGKGHEADVGFDVDVYWASS